MVDEGVAAIAAAAGASRAARRVSMFFTISPGGASGGEAVSSGTRFLGWVLGLFLGAMFCFQ